MPDWLRPQHYPVTEFAEVTGVWWPLKGSSCLIKFLTLNGVLYSAILIRLFSLSVSLHRIAHYFRLDSTQGIVCSTEQLTAMPAMPRSYLANRADFAKVTEKWPHAGKCSKRLKDLEFLNRPA